MTAPVKLAAFAAVLAVIFGAAALAGGAVGRIHDPAAAAKGEMDMAADPIRGLAVSENGLTLELARRSAHAAAAFGLRFRIVGADGRAVRAFDLEHTKRMHLILVRRDLSGFQHLHPTLRADGTWTTPVTLPAAGTYRVFADFSVDGRPTTLADDLQVDGDVRSRPLPAPAKTAETDGFRVRLVDGAVRAGEESPLTFEVTREGRPVPLQDYLGAKGHLVALREGDLAFLHVHPDASSLRFDATFPNAGSYRLFLQFQVAGRVHTAAFTMEVSR
ncbi:MAG TPA: hypothetical protein VFL60_09690 [Gaiellaceae bacterium]|nr:hypothetical protein [Gaiellaceae bacterium]